MTSIHLEPAALEQLRQLDSCSVANAIETFGVRLRNAGFADSSVGPAPYLAFTMNRFHYNWHWFWDTGNGDLGNQGIHELDLARWGLGVKFPKKVFGDRRPCDVRRRSGNAELLNCAYRIRTVRMASADHGVRGPPLDDE